MSINNLPPWKSVRLFFPFTKLLVNSHSPKLNSPITQKNPNPTQHQPTNATNKQKPHKQKTHSTNIKYALSITSFSFNCPSLAELRTLHGKIYCQELNNLKPGLLVPRYTCRLAQDDGAGDAQLRKQHCQAKKTKPETKNNPTQTRNKTKQKKPTNSKQISI